MLDSITYKVYKSIEGSPSGITTLDLLMSLQLCNPPTLKTILSRLNKAKKIVRLKRGVYATYPLVDAFITGQAMFNGYLGFSTALYLHGLITEVPFTVMIVTTNSSASKTIGGYEFKAIALKEKAVGFGQKEEYVISTRAKTLFDCIYLPAYSIEEEKLVNIFKEAKLSKKEWIEFKVYVEKFIKVRSKERFYEMKKRIMKR